MMALALLAMQTGQAQVSVQQNNPITPGTDYVGWDNTTTVPLEVRHDGPYPIDWYTDAIRRLTLLPDATYTIGAFPSMTTNGFSLLSPDVDMFYTNTGPGPFSLLHLADADNNAQSLGYRPWMRNGVYMSGNNDMMYVGQLFRAGEDEHDAVVALAEGGEAEDLADGIAGHGANCGEVLEGRIPSGTLVLHLPNGNN